MNGIAPVSDYLPSITDEIYHVVHIVRPKFLQCSSIRTQLCHYNIASTYESRIH